jgi:hypothetical protein
MLYTNLKRLKVRLQFTGWLQYVPTAFLSLFLFLIANFIRLSGKTWVARPFNFIGIILLMAVVFDLITVKFHLHPPESLPKRNDNIDMFDLMRIRRSCRSFQIRKLTTEDFKELMKNVRLRSNEPKIGKAAIRFEYISESLTVWPVVNATEFLVAIAPKDYNRLAVIDVGRTLQKIVIDATRMGIGTCWIGPGAEQTSIARQLGERFKPQEDHIICVCAIGYKSAYLPAFLRFMNFQFHRRLPLSSLFFEDSGLKKPLNVKEFPANQFGRNYEVCQWSPSSYNGQTTRCAAVITQNEEKIRLERFDFFAATESRYYAAVAVGIWCANWEMGCQAQGIPGHFAVLSSEQRGVNNENNHTGLPRYDVSWVPAKKL